MGSGCQGGLLGAPAISGACWPFTPAYIRSQLLWHHAVAFTRAAFWVHCSALHYTTVCLYITTCFHMLPHRVLRCPLLTPLQRFYRWFNGANFPKSYNNSILIAQVPALMPSCLLPSACLPACPAGTLARWVGVHAACPPSCLLMLLLLCFLQGQLEVLLAANESCRFPALDTVAARVVEPPKPHWRASDAGDSGPSRPIEGQALCALSVRRSARRYVLAGRAGAAVQQGQPLQRFGRVWRIGGRQGFAHASWLQELRIVNLTCIMSRWDACTHAAVVMRQTTRTSDH